MVGTRCPEIVIALLSNPTKSDPIGAIFATRPMRLRRRVRGEGDELANFVRQFKTRQNAIDINQGIKDGKLAGPPIRVIDGPISGVCDAASWLGCDWEASSSGITLRTIDGMRINFTAGHHTDFKRQILEVIRQGILHGLKTRVAGPCEVARPGETCMVYLMLLTCRPPWPK